METLAPKNSVNNDIYELYGDRWYTAYDDPVALLRAENRAKVPWILEKIRAHFPSAGQPENLKVLDVGCGAGFLTNEFSRQGFSVTGIDASGESLACARRHDSTSRVHYEKADAYKLPFPAASFDVVTAMDFLEHVDNPALAIQEMGRVLKPGGLFFYHTFNRNWISHFAVIKLVEWIVRNTPKNMHVIELFIKPEEMANYSKAAGMEVRDVVGLRPRFSTIPIKNYFTGIVPESLSFKITRSTLLSYLGYAEKK